MYSLLKKLDQFKAFAKQKVSMHSRALVIQYDKSRTNYGEFIESSFQHHQQMLEEELAKRVDELSAQNGPLLKPSLSILKDYYLGIFKTRAEVNGIKFTLKLLNPH